MMIDGTVYQLPAPLFLPKGHYWAGHVQLETIQEYQAEILTMPRSGPEVKPPARKTSSSKGNSTVFSRLRMFRFDIPMKMEMVP